MSSKEDRLRLQHERLENERRYRSKQFVKEFSRLADSISDTCKEEAKLRKQHERLENEKQYYKRNSFLTNDRKLVVPDDKPQSKSCHAKADMSNVKSKLFDYEKSAPRSRRQLAIDTENPPSRSSLSRPSPLSPMYTHRPSHNDLAHHSALTPDQSPRMRKSSTRVSSLTDHPEVTTHRKREHMHEKTVLEKEATRRATHSKDQSVSFDPNAPSRSHAKGTRVSNMPRPSIEVERADDDDDTEKLKALYDRAIQTVQKADESALINESSHSGTLKFHDRRGSVRSNTDLRNKSGLDVAALKELEAILNDARLYSSRKSSKEDHSRLDLGSNRAQKKRIHHLEQVLKQLNPNYGSNQEDVDPMKILQCSYLRLSKSNVNTLESMLRQAGKDPGIHIHSDVTDYDIWKGLKQERTDIKPEERVSSKSVNAKKSAKT